MARKTKQTLKAKQEAVTTPKPLKECEQRRYEAYVAREADTPRAVKFVPGPDGKPVSVDPSIDDKNLLAGTTAASGSISGEFSAVLIDQAINALPGAVRQDATNASAVLAAMTGLAPQNEMEGMLVAQMTACHNAAMECLRLAFAQNQPFEGRKMIMGFADRFMRTFTLQVEVLGKHRKGGQQKVVVEHVHVYPGGQAIVGNVNQTPRGRGDINGNDDSTPCRQAIGQQPQAIPVQLGDGQKMLCPVQEDGETVPATGHGER